MLSSRFLATASTRNVFLRKSFLSTSSQAYLIVNAVGKDRLGIVSDISKHVTEIGGNVGESQASKLGNHFSMMMLVNVPADQKSVLEDRLKTLDGLKAAVFETEVDQAQYKPKIAYSGFFELEGANNPGIVHKLTMFLTQNGLSVDKLETSDEIAPHGGTTLFKMEGIANAFEPVAAGFDIEDIKQRLTKLGDELNCDIHMEDRSPDLPKVTNNRYKKAA